jgi:Flp pilus assembly protein TadG
MKMLGGIKPKFGKTTCARRGESMVEFALVAPLFFLLVFGITDFGRLFFIQETLQYALREAGRFAVTGQNNGTNRVEAIKMVAENEATGLGLTDSSIQVTSGGSNNFAGGPRQTVTISMNYGVKLITPMIGRYFGPSQTYTCKVSVSFMNEPFDPSKTN